MHWGLTTSLDQNDNIFKLFNHQKYITNLDKYIEDIELQYHVVLKNS